MTFVNISFAKGYIDPFMALLLPFFVAALFIAWQEKWGPIQADIQGTLLSPQNSKALHGALTNVISLSISSL